MSFDQIKILKCVGVCYIKMYSVTLGSIFSKNFQNAKNQTLTKKVALIKKMSAQIYLWMRGNAAAAAAVVESAT